MGSRLTCLLKDLRQAMQGHARWSARPRGSWVSGFSPAKNRGLSAQPIWPCYLKHQAIAPKLALRAKPDNPHPMKSHSVLLCGLLCMFGALSNLLALEPAVQAKVDEQVALARELAALPAIVQAVKAQNQALPADLAAMSQDKWKVAGVLDPVVRGLTKNPAAEAIKAKKSPLVSEAFVNDAAGNKVAMLSKTTSWRHSGSAKHDKPMAGALWIGAVEVDSSTGLQQVQIAVPVLDEGKPIGSMVLGLALSKMN